MECSLTQEVKLLGEEVKHDAGVHGEEDDEVRPQRTPHKEMVNSCPVSCVQRDLHTHTHTSSGTATNINDRLPHSLDFLQRGD